VHLTLPWRRKDVLAGLDALAEATPEWVEKSRYPSRSNI
jgi:hypothetical protein